MFDNVTASAGLAIAATAGTLFAASPASALSPRDAGTPISAQVTAVRAPAAPTVPRGDGDGGWWWWSSPSRFHHSPRFRGGRFRGPGVRHRFYGGYGGFAGDGFGVGIAHNVGIVTDDVHIGVQNSNTNVVIG